MARSFVALLPVLAAVYGVSDARGAASGPPLTTKALEGLRVQLGSPALKQRRAACERISAQPVTRNSKLSPADHAVHNRWRDLYLRRLRRPKPLAAVQAQRWQLTAAKIKLPSMGGWFREPKLKRGKPSPIETDALKALIGRAPPRAGQHKQAYVTALETLCILRGLAGSRDLTVARPLVKLAFLPHGITFRWSVVRTIRGLGGYAVPALLKLRRLRTLNWRRHRKRYLFWKFSDYLLTTMEEANPIQALASADKPLKLKLLDAYGKHCDSEAVVALIRHTSHHDAALKAKARWAIQRYFYKKGADVCRRPRVRTRRLKLPGGQETARRMKLYASFRERATIEVRRELERLSQGRYDRGIPGRALVTMLFKKQDERFDSRFHRLFEAALTKYRAGQVKEALRAAEAALRRAPSYGKRSWIIAALLTRGTDEALAGHLRRAADTLEHAALLLSTDRSAAARAKQARILADVAYLRALDWGGRRKRTAAIGLHRRALALGKGHLGARIALSHLAPPPRYDSGYLWALVTLAALGVPGMLLALGLALRLRQR